MTEINFDVTCPQCNKLIKRDMNSEPLRTCSYCKASLHKSAVENVRSAVDMASNNKLKGDSMYPPFHLRDIMPFTSSTPKVEIKGISHWLSGEAAFIGLKEAVDELARTAPEDHDVLITAFDLTVREIRYIEPHTFLFSGIDNNGHNSFVVCHFSQLLARVIYRPKTEKERIITGFSRQNEK